MHRMVPTTEAYPASSVSRNEMRDFGLAQGLGPCWRLLPLSLSSWPAPFSRVSHPDARDEEGGAGLPMGYISLCRLFYLVCASMSSPAEWV